MGRSLGGLAGVLGIGLAAVLAAPVLALVPAMVVDRGPDGAPRVAAFPPALVVLDPLVWRCVRNSVAVAGVATVGSLALGTGLGMLLGRRRFWGRGPLGLLALAPLAVGPIWLAPGVVAWIGGESSWAWLAARSFLGQPGDECARWLALAWVGVAGGTPLVILATRAALRRVDPAWADAARVVGAGRWRAWRDVTWPTIRPELGRVGGAVFAAALVEPAGPLILGLRRTLAVELADAALRSVEPNRAATLATIAAVVALAARALLARWGGGAAVAPGGTPPAIPPEPRAGTRLGLLAVVALAAWAAFAIGPAASVVRDLVGAAVGGHPSTWATCRLVVAEAATPATLRWALNSATSAGLAVGLGCVGLGLGLAPRGGRGGLRRASRGLAPVPPLPLAVGALAIPGLLATWADATGSAPLAGLLGGLRAELSPGRSPGWLLVLVLAATRWPALLLAQPGGRDDRPDPSGPVDAALLVGASAREAGRLAGGGRRDGIARVALVAWAWAATDLASAWVLTALDERRTLASAALDLVGHGTGPLDPRLLGLFATMTAVRLVGIALIVAPTRSGRPVGWIAAA